MNNPTIFFQANELARKGKVAEALILYQKIIDKDAAMKNYAFYNMEILKKKNHSQPNKVFKAIAESDFFDHEFYFNKYAVSLTGINDFVTHYIEFGAKNNFNPSEKFDTKFYREKYKDVDGSKLNPLYHFVKHGLAEGRQPKYKEENNAVVHQGTDLELIKKSKYFDPSWYVENYIIKNNLKVADVALHYLEEGYAKGFDPGPEFSSLGYLGYYRDVLSAGINPLVHFLRSGQREGRKSKPDTRAAALGLTRLTPAESGDPDTILKYDSLIATQDISNNKLLFVHVHLYHEDMFDQVVSYLLNIPVKFELGVSVRSQQYINLYEQKFISRLPNAANVIVKNVPNRGRDVAPWVLFFHEEINKADLFMHFHTKKSVHNPNHADWFRFAMHNMLGSKGVVNQILDIFEDDLVGVVAPCYFWSLSNQPNYGKNKEVVEKLYKRVSSKELPEECPDYPAGSFFWAKKTVLKPLLDLNLSLDDFDEESGQIDETLAHGVERLIGLLPLLAGKRLHKVTVDIAFDMVNYIYPNRVANADNIVCRVKNNNEDIPTSRKSKIAIFSCVSGGYEEIVPLIRDRKDADVYLYSDKVDIVIPEGVLARVSPYVSHVPVMTARYVKTHPHVWFSDYDYVFWIDSNIYFMGDLYKYIDALESAAADMGVIYHPARHSFIEEGVELAQTAKVNIDTLNAQVMKYKNNKKVIKSRLIETNFWVCKPSNTKVAQMMSIWWSEINNNTHRDQISVNYAIEMSGIKVVNLMPNGESARSHKDFLIFEHAFKDRLNLIDSVNAALGGVK